MPGIHALQLFLPLAFVFLGSLFGAALLRIAARWVEKVEVPWGDAYWMMVRVTGLIFVLGFVVAIALSNAEASPKAELIASYVKSVVDGLVQSWVICRWMRIPFGRAFLISLVVLGIILALTGLVFGGMSLVAEVVG